MIPAIVLAAGMSSRMGRAKALLPLPGGHSFLSRIDATLRSAGIEDVVVVVGYDAAAIRAAASALRFAENPDPSRGQLSSLVVGLDAVQATGVPPAALVTIVDVPLVSSDTVSRVLAAWNSSRAPIVRPARHGRHGHPVIFGAALFDELRQADPGVGARGVVHAHAAEAVDVEVADPGAFDDIDTPEDYARLVR